MDILISQDHPKGYTMTTGSYTVQVYCGDCFLNVYAGKCRLGNGRTFHQDTTAERLAAAIASYKASAVKSALEALAAHLA